MKREFLALIPAIALIAACAGQPVSAPVSVADTIAREPQLSTLDGLVKQSGLTETLKGAGPYTVFAPTNDAFKSMSAKTMSELAQDPAKLKNLLSYHVLATKLMASDVTNSNPKTAQGANLGLSKAGSFVTVEDAMVQTADIVATNGVVHTVDRVLMPPQR
jgi:uncharacterized surface protein with fasciclin (FAS1) repeats